MTESVAHLLERIAQQHLSGLLAVLFGQGSDLRVAEAHATHERTPRLRGVSGAHEHTHACDARVTGEPVAAAIARALGARVSAQRRTSSAMPCAVQNATTSVRVMNGCKSICEACPVCQSPASFIVGVDGDVPRAPPADGAAERARAMHEGEAPVAQIHGQASLAEAKALVEEGVPVAPLPFPVVPPKQVN